MTTTAPLSDRQLAWLALGLKQLRDANALRRRGSELLVQLFLAYVIAADHAGRSALHNGQLNAMLSSHRVGTDHVDRHTIDRLRRELERLGLISCKQGALRRTANGELRDAPWQVRVIASGEGAASRGFRWAQAGKWVRTAAEMARTQRLRPIELQIALYLALAFDATGSWWDVTRSDMAAKLGVSRNAATSALNRLETLGLLAPGSSRDDKERGGQRPYRFAIVATSAAAADADSTGENAEPEVGDANAHDNPTPAQLESEPSAPNPVRLRLTRAQYSADWVSALLALCTQPQHAGSAPVLLDCPDGRLRALRTGRGGEPITVMSGEALDAAIEALPVPATAPAPVPAPTPRAPIPAVAAHDAEVAVLPEAAVKSTKKKRVTKAEAAALRAELWWPQLVDEAIAQAGHHHKGGAATFTPSTLAAHFYKPTLALQAKYPAPIVEKALRITLNKHIADKERFQPWANYAAAICKDKGQTIGLTAPRPGTPAAAEATLNECARAARDLLQRASVLNSRGEREAAHAILSELVSMAASLAPLFDGSEERAEYQLRLAYKQGGSDLHAPRNRYGLDNLPEWLPEGEQAPTAAQPETSTPRQVITTAAIDETPKDDRPVLPAAPLDAPDADRPAATEPEPAAPTEPKRAAPTELEAIDTQADGRAHVVAETPQRMETPQPTPITVPTTAAPAASDGPYTIRVSAPHDQLLAMLLASAVRSGCREGDAEVAVGWADGALPLQDGRGAVCVYSGDTMPRPGKRPAIEAAVYSTLYQWQALPAEVAA